MVIVLLPANRFRKETQNEKRKRVRLGDLVNVQVDGGAEERIDLLLHPIGTVPSGSSSGSYHWHQAPDHPQTNQTKAPLK